MIKNSKNIKITLEESSLDLEGCSNIEIHSSHTINTLVLKNCSNIKFNGTLVLDAFIDSSKDITITTDKIEYLNTKDSFIVLNINFRMAYLKCMNTMVNVHKDWEFYMKED